MRTPLAAGAAGADISVSSRKSLNAGAEIGAFSASASNTAFCVGATSITPLLITSATTDCRYVLAMPVPCQTPVVIVPSVVMLDWPTYVADMSRSGLPATPLPFVTEIRFAVPLIVRVAEVPDPVMAYRPVDPRLDNALSALLADCLPAIAKVNAARSAGMICAKARRIAVNQGVVMRPASAPDMEMT